MTGWADDVGDESEEEDGRDGDVLGDVRAVNERERTGRGEEGEEGDIPYEQKWETDLEAYQPGKVRPGVEGHARVDPSITSSLMGASGY